MTTRRVLPRVGSALVVALFVAGAIGGWVVLVERVGLSIPNLAYHDGTSATRATPPRSSATRVARRAVAAPAQRHPRRATRAIDESRALATFLRDSIYPPTSRPLGHDNVDLIHFARRFERPRPAVSDPSVTILLTGDRAWIVGHEGFNAKLEVLRDGFRFDPSVRRAELLRLRSTDGHVDRTFPAMAVEFRAGDGAWVAPIQPPNAGTATGPIRYRLEVEIELAESTEGAALSFSHTPTEAIPARFTGDFTDRVEDGSLVVDAGVEVFSPGWYLVDCNLYDRHDEPVAWTRFKGDLSVTDDVARLEFFGKVLVDAKAAGPYRIGELRGARHVEGHDPDMERLAAFEGSYVTAAYEHSDFSDAGWDSPRKRAKVVRLSAGTRSANR